MTVGHLARILTPVALLAVGGCGPMEIPVDVELLLPADRQALTATNNVSVQIEPDGPTETFAVQGLEFAVQLQLQPRNEPRSVAVFLAQDDSLLAWGRTPPAPLAATEALAVYAGLAGRLSTPPELPELGPRALAAPARGGGAIVLEADGTTWFFDALGFRAQTASPLDMVADALPAPDDGALVRDALGGVMRLAWDGDLRGYRFDPRDDAWIALRFSDPDLASDRAGSAHLVDATAEHVLVFGGGEHTDGAIIDLVPGSGGILAVTRAPEVELHQPRRGATATWVTRQHTDAGELVLVVGGEDTATPIVEAVPDGRMAGPEGPWTGLRCVQLDRGEGTAELSRAIRVLCAGGVREGRPTADALLVEVPATAERALETMVLPGFLPVPMADPRWFADDSAVYAQGAGHWMAVVREDLSVAEIADDALRDKGGDSVTLGTGVTLLLGGVDPDGDPVAAWRAFTAAQPPS